MLSHPSRRELLKSGVALAAPALLGAPALAAAEAVDPYADAVLVDGPLPPLGDGSFTVAVLPDTQNYSEYYPQNFAAQTQWIVEQREQRNIACVLHLGDVTNHSTEAEWDAAVAAMRTLDGHVPYCMVPGNHDYSDGGNCVDRTTQFSKRFPAATFREMPTFGGTYDREPERTENTFHTFAAGGRKFLVIALEFGPRRDVVRWANEVAAAHPEHEAILITHAYMYYDDTRYDWQTHGHKQTWNPHSYGVARATADDVCDGQQLWDELVSRHENFVMTLNGHVLEDGLGRLTSTTPGGRAVHQMLVNFQMRPRGGDGWLRLLEFLPDGKTVDVCDYSPIRNQRNEAAENKFTLTLR